ncbi:MAG: ABC transporter permease [Candidatus Promineifilaceae bacterium]|nr:ABC transporter permease [Candidatus Promineifilaceae bacterium]
MLMLGHIWTVVRKETIDNLRDRRAMFNALFAVLFNPILYIFLFGFLNRSFSEQSERPLQLPVDGADYAPNLVQYLEQNNVIIMPPPNDPRSAVKDGAVDMVLIIPDDYSDNFRAGVPATVQLLEDVTNQEADIAVDRAERLLRQYSSQIGNLRLIARGVSPAIAVAVPVERVSVSPRSEAGASVVLNLLPVIMITAVFFGGFYLAVDMTAGERERESLEPLLLNPVPRWQVLLGKYLTALTFTVTATFLATALFLVLLGIRPVQEFTALRVNLGFDVIFTAVLLMIPVAIMAVAIEMLVASYASTVKEAQTYTQLVAMAGFLPAIFLSVLPISAQPWMQYIPTVAQLFLINQVSRGEILDVTRVALISTITIIVGILALSANIRLYNRERIILGK